MTKALRAKVEHIARLRATGKTWPQIAESTDLPLTTLWSYPHRYAEVFRPAYEQAYEEYWGELEFEATGVLRELSGDLDSPPAVRQAAAASILTSAIKLRPQRVEHSGEIVTRVRCIVPGMEVDIDDDDD